MKPSVAVSALVITLFSLGAHRMRDSNAGQNGNIEETIRQLDKQWIKAYPRRDTALLERIYADDLVVTNPDGSIGNKAQEISGLKSGTFSFDSITNDVVSVRVFANLAVGRGCSMMKGRYQEQDISGWYR